MKTGKTLVELAQEIQRQAESKKDFIAPTGQIQVVVPEQHDQPMLALGAISSGNVVPLDARQFEINALAHGQLAELTGVPKAYYDRCMREAPKLFADNVNTWLRQLANNSKQGRRLIRTLDGNVRAILSDSYRPLENFDLANAVLPVLQEQNLFIASCEVTERRLYIKAFDRGIEREIAIKGSDPAHTFLKDVVFPSITISNSEVGYGALSIAAGIYTGGCTNFASFNDSRMRKYHVGSKAAGSDEVYALLSDKTRQLTDAAIWAQVRDVVKSAFEIAQFEKLVGRIQETSVQKIEGDVVKVVDLAGEKLGFTKDENKNVLKWLIEGGDLSRYGLFNAITRTAEDLPSYDRATEFERAGGRVIELPRNEWELLAKAA